MVIKKLQAKLDLSTLCPNISDKSYCRASKQLQIPTEDFLYFKIKPGFYVKEFSGYEQICAAQIASLVYSVYYTENAVEDYRLQMQLADCHKDDDSLVSTVYVLASSSESIKKVRPLNEYEYNIEMDKNQVDVVKKIILDYYRANPKSLRESYAYLVSQATSLFESDIPLELRKKPIHLVPDVYKMRVLEKHLHCEVINVKIKDKDPVQLVKIGINTALIFSIVENGRVSMFRDGGVTLREMFVINESLHLVLSWYYGRFIVFNENSGWQIDAVESLSE